MYKRLIRPILFRVKPETIHHIIMWWMRAIHFIPCGRAVLRALFSVKHPALEREVFGVRFPNPVGLAAGFDKDAKVYRELSAMGFGFIEVGTITPKPQPGNPKPRLFRLPQDKALINRMGFNNKGLDNALKNLRTRSYKTVLGGNLGRNTLTPNEQAPADYLKLFRSLYEYIDYFVVNISCPNVANLSCLQNKENVREILEQLFEFRRGQDDYRPILLKISPDLTWEQIDDMVEILMGTPLDGIVAVNTTTSREGLNTPKKTVAKLGNGGLSGAPLTKRAVEVVRYVHEKSKGCYPIIGVGGIMNEDDAVEMLRAGASLIQVYTGYIYEGPMIAKKICKKIIKENL